MRRDTRSAYRARQKAVERGVDEAVSAIKAVEDAKRAALKEAAREREATRQRFTRDDLLGAVVVRTRYGWMEVIRINQKTVTVEGVFGPQTVPFDRVLEFKGGAR